MSSQQYHFCIVGAGIAGSTLAYILGRRGYKVAIVEKSWTEPKEFVGELLQPSGVNTLNTLGLADVFEGYEAQKILGYSLFLEGEKYSIPYPSVNGLQEVGYSFQYGKFVQKLRSYLNEHSSISQFEGTVSELVEDSNGQVEGVEVLSQTNLEKDYITADTTIICSGTGSRILRKKVTTEETDIKGFMLGVLLENCSIPLPNHGHLIIADPAPVLAYPISTNTVRVLVDFSQKSKFSSQKELIDFLCNKTAPQLPFELQEPFIDAVQQGRFRKKATCMYRAEPSVRSDLILLGDSLNQRHPLTGSGMSIALADSLALADAFTEFDQVSKTNNKEEVIREFYEKRQSRNSAANILSFALYQTLKHDYLKKVFFDYLKKHSHITNEPMLLLSCNQRDWNPLIKNFFQMSLCSIKEDFKTTKLLDKPNHLFKSYYYGMKIFISLLISECEVFRCNETIAKNNVKKTALDSNKMRFEILAMLVLTKTVGFTAFKTMNYLRSAMRNKTSN